MTNPIEIEHSDNVYFAFVPVLRDAPDFRPSGWRAVESAERLNSILIGIPKVAQEWQGYPVVRAPRSDPSALRISTSDDWTWNTLPTARAITLQASELLHHARVALEYLAYNAVWLDTGSRSKATKFPLLRDASKWNQERRKSIGGVSAEHEKWIEEVQPYNGVEWSNALLALSNRDKHRVAADLIPTYEFKVDLQKVFADPLGQSDFIGYQVLDSRLRLGIAPALEAGSPDRRGYPLEETLLQIVRGVVDITNRFLIQAKIKPITLSTTVMINEP